MPSPLRRPGRASTARGLLVTGGSGYLGLHLVGQAAASWDVAATFFGHPERLSGCRAVPLDVRDGEAVARLVADLRPEAVIHTAAAMNSPAGMEAVIAAGTRHVALAARAAGARLVVLSTDAVFDGERAPYAESDPPRPITPYGRAKARAERAVAEIYPGAAIVRTSLIYGLAPVDPRTRAILDALRGGPPLTLFRDEIRCPVWVDQLAATLLELAGTEWKEVGGIWHLAGPQPLSRYEFGVRLARAYGLDPAGLASGLSDDSGMVRPRDCTLTCGRAQAHLQSPLWGVDEVLAHEGRLPAPWPLAD